MTYSQGYFEVAAQLIPVLFLAMVVEDRLRPGEESEGARVARSWLLALLVTGEILALAVVAGGISPSPVTGMFVSGAMLLSTFLIALPVIEIEMNGRSRKERIGHAGAGLLVIGTVFVVIIGMTF